VRASDANRLMFDHVRVADRTMLLLNTVLLMVVASCSA